MFFEEYKHVKIACSNPKLQKTLAEQYAIGDCIYEQIDGNESFVLYDGVNQKTIAVRDFFGFYPLYYTTISGKIHFSDSVKDLLLYWHEKNNRLPDINHNRLIDYFNNQRNFRVIDNETFFDGIYRLLPAHVLVIEAGKDIIYKPYKKIDLQQYQGLSDETYVRKFREIFVASVKRNTEGYHPIAAHVSGGLDSSSVACVAQSLRKEPIMTLHLNPGIPAAEEQHYANLIAKKWHTKHLNLPSPTNFYEAMEQAIHLSALPETANLPITFFSPMAEACREAGTEILLSGHCGDAVVGYGYEYLEELCNQQNWQELKRSLKKWSKDDVGLRKYATRKQYATQLLVRNLKKDPSFANMCRTAWVLVRHFGVWGKEVFNLWQERKKIQKNYSNRNLLRNHLKKSGTTPQVLDVSTLVNTTLTPQQERQMKSFYETLGVEHYEISHQFYKHTSKLPNGTKIGFPFLDQELIALCLNVPNKLRFGEGKIRGLLRQAMSDYLPKEIAERTTKAVFNNYALFAFKEMYATFKQRNKDRYDSLAVWQYVDRQAFEKLASDILVVGSTVSSKQALVATRTIYLSIWLDYIYNQSFLIKKTVPTI